MISAMTVSGVLLGSTSTLRFRRTAAPKYSVAAELSSLTSQFGGLKLSQITPFKPISKPLATVFKPVARRVCPFTGKKPNKKNLVSFSNHKTIKRQFVNLQYKRIWWEEGKRFVKLRLSTKALKTIEKNGLDAVAKKAGFDLLKKAGPTLEKIAEVSAKQKAKKELLDKAELERKEKLEATLRLKK